MNAMTLINVVDTNTLHDAEIGDLVMLPGKVLAVVTEFIRSYEDGIAWIDGVAVVTEYGETITLPV